MPVRTWAGDTGPCAAPTACSSRTRLLSPCGCSLPFHRRSALPCAHLHHVVTMLEPCCMLVTALLPPYCMADVCAIRSPHKHSTNKQPDVFLGCLFHTCDAQAVHRHLMHRPVCPGSSIHAFCEPLLWHAWALYCIPDAGAVGERGAVARPSPGSVCVHPGAVWGLLRVGPQEGFADQGAGWAACGQARA